MARGGAHQLRTDRCRVHGPTAPRDMTDNDPSLDTRPRRAHRPESCIPAESSRQASGAPTTTNCSAPRPASTVCGGGRIIPHAVIPHAVEIAFHGMRGPARVRCPPSGRS
eukprot:6375096-Prymnesium_polylepis.1